MIADWTASLPAAGSIVLAIASLGAIARYRSQNRQDHAGAEAHLASAAVDWQTVYEKTIDRLEERLASLEAEAPILRDAARAAESSAAEARLEAQRARTEKAKAETRVAELEAELARALKEAGDERHALVNDVRALLLKDEAKDIEIAAMRVDYEGQIARLRDELDTLRAQLGQTERRATERRADDERQTTRQGTQDARQAHQDDRQERQDDREARLDAVDRPPPDVP